VRERGVISTSNRRLAAETGRGRFRRDLYYRLSGVHLTVPPLRQRTEDIAVLTWHFVNMYAHEVRRCVRGLDGEMLKLFEQYAWPGNVRQLRNVVRTALILGHGDTLSLDGAPWLAAELQRGGAPDAQADSLRLQELERQAIFEALRRTKRNQAKAARLLGITDRTLREKLRRYRQDGYALPTGDGT
jgi:DNA-binding NtrC family response regulator